jgi:hypothetical protein
MILDAEDIEDYEVEISYSDSLAAPDTETPTRVFIN